MWIRWQQLWRLLWNCWWYSTSFRKASFEHWPVCVFYSWDICCDVSVDRRWCLVLPASCRRQMASSADQPILPNIVSFVLFCRLLSKTSAMWTEHLSFSLSISLPTVAKCSVLHLRLPGLLVCRAIRKLIPVGKVSEEFPVLVVMGQGRLACLRGARRTKASSTSRPRPVWRSFNFPITYQFCCHSYGKIVTFIMVLKKYTDTVVSIPNLSIPTH